MAEEALALLRARGCMTSAQLASALGITPHKAYHIMKRLSDEGAVVGMKLGNRVAVWCAPGARPERILSFVRRALCEVLADGRGRVRTVRSGDVLRRALEGSRPSEIADVFGSGRSVVTVRVIFAATLRELLREFAVAVFGDRIVVDRERALRELCQCQ